MVGARPIGGTDDINAVETELTGVLQKYSDAIPNSHVQQAPVLASVFGGHIVCGGIAGPKESVGECFWQDGVVSVQTVTFSADIATINAMTAQVVTDLRDQTTSE